MNMDFDPRTLDYLAGRDFSNGAAFALGPPGRAPRRADRLLALAAGRRVLHVGCCDHLQLVAEKMAQGNYLHANLCRSAAVCVGIDTNVEGVRLLRGLGFEQVYLPDELPAQEFDICLLADVIEHVGDPVSFLRSMRRHRFQTLVIVTPNVFRWRNCLPGPEVVNTDHRYWFSPYTLAKVVTDAGYTPQALELVHGDYTSRRGAVAARLLGHWPRYRESLLLQARRRVGVVHNELSGTSEPIRPGRPPSP